MSNCLFSKTVVIFFFFSISICRIQKRFGNFYNVRTNTAVLLFARMLHTPTQTSVVLLLFIWLSFSTIICEFYENLYSKWKSGSKQHDEKKTTKNWRNESIRNCRIRVNSRETPNKHIWRVQYLSIQLCVICCRYREYVKTMYRRN